MSADRINRLLAKLNGKFSDREYAALAELRKLAGSDLPNLLLEKYSKERLKGPREFCVTVAMRYARENSAAVTLGIRALSDRSGDVVYAACMLLAYSLRLDAVPALRKLAENAKDKAIAEDALAAIDAIENQNHHYFVDREHSGKIKLNVVLT